MRARRDTAPLGSRGLARDAIRTMYQMQHAIERAGQPSTPPALEDFEGDDPTTPRMRNNNSLIYFGKAV